MRKIDWNTIDSLCEKLEQMVRECGTQFKGICGLARGGLPAAVILSHRLNIPMLNEKNLAGALFGANKSHYLVVDDINDTGHTLKPYQGCERVTTIVLYERESSALRVDLVGEKITDDEWLLFPWESAARVERDRLDYLLSRVDLNQLLGEE